jgi:hypothetical protein
VRVKLEPEPGPRRSFAEGVVMFLIQKRSFELTTHINLNQFLIVSAARKNVAGFIGAGPTVFWNVSKR